MPNRLGNPAVSGRITITYMQPVPALNPPPIAGSPGESFLPSIPGAEDIVITISSPQTFYPWIPLVKAPITVKFAFKSDGTPLATRPVVFIVQGNFIGGAETHVLKTDINGLATWPFKPFGVPADSSTAISYSFRAEFLGY